MTDDRLKNYVLRCADDDPDLTDDARLVVLAALGDPDDLAHVLGSDATSPELVDALTTPTTPRRARRRLPQVDQRAGLPRHRSESPAAPSPGPGLVVVAGRRLRQDRPGRSARSR